MKRGRGKTRMEGEQKAGKRSKWSVNKRFLTKKKEKRNCGLNCLRAGTSCK